MEKNCGECGYSIGILDGSDSKLFQAKYDPLFSHIKRVHYGFEPYKCLKCSTEFPTLIEIESHIESAHDGLWEVQTKKNAAMEANVENDVRRMIAHEMNADNSGNSSRMEDTSSTDDRKQQFCTDCKWNLGYRPNGIIRRMEIDPLISHVSRIHLGYKPYQCEKCQGSFPTLLEIQRHNELAHASNWKVIKNKNDEMETKIAAIIGQIPNTPQKRTPNVAQGDSPAQRSASKTEKYKSYMATIQNAKQRQQLTITQKRKSDSNVPGSVSPAKRTVRPEQTAGCFNMADLEGVKQYTTIHEDIECPVCGMILHAIGMARHFKAFHTADLDNAHYFIDCKICDRSIFKSGASVHANMCNKEGTTETASPNVARARGRPPIKAPNSAPRTTGIPGVVVRIYDEPENDSDQNMDIERNLEIQSKDDDQAGKE